MASEDSNIGDNFLSHIERVRREIETKFKETHSLLEERESDLLAELQRLIDEYTGDRITQQLKQLSFSKEALRDTLTGNENKEILNQNLNSINAHILELETKLQILKDTYRSVSLEWDVELDKKLSLAGEIRLNSVRGGIRDYKAIGDPVMIFGKHTKMGYSPGAFGCPLSIAINPEDNSIYICDGSNNRVHVYSKTFEFISTFNEKMKFPAGICIKHNKVYITQFTTHCLNVYSTEGNYLQSVGTKGKKKLMFDKPRGLDVSIDRDRVYIAEFENKRIQCLNLNLKFDSLIEDIFGARDVKLTSNEIVVLSLRNPCVSLFSYSHQFIRNIIPLGKCSRVTSPYSIFLDSAANILISDIKSHNVYVFSLEGELVHRLGREGEKRGEFIMPTGIAIDSLRRIIVASENPNYCIQLF